MPKKEKPLPEPPSTPFGKKGPFQQNGHGDALLADQMALAMSEGKLKEFLQENLPDSEYALKLAEMMMAMTGMSPQEGLSGKPVQGKKDTQEKQAAQSHAGGPPDDVVLAARAGDVKSLSELLARERAKRTGAPPEPGEVQGEAKPDAGPSGKPAIEKEVIEQLMKIASDNGLSLDWVLFRALKRYVEEYRNTGNL